MRTVAVSFLLALAVPTVWAQRPVTSPSGYGRILFPGGGPPGTGGTAGFGRAIAPGGVVGTGIGPAYPVNPVYPTNPIYPGVPAVARPRRNLPYYNFATVLPGTAWPTAGYPVSYPYADGGYYGYEPPQAQFINNYTPSPNYGSSGQAEQPPVVIVNQYFRPDQAPVPQTNSTAPQESTSAAPAQTAAPASNRPDQPYFLIAMKDTTIYAASAYWVEGNILNYVTLQGNENQVSLDLVDRDLSQRLNRDRSVSFGLPSAR